MSLHINETQLDSSNRGSKPASKVSSGLTGSPSAGVGSDNKGTGGHASTTSFVPAVGTKMDSTNRGAKPAPKVNP